MGVEDMLEKLDSAVDPRPLQIDRLSAGAATLLETVVHYCLMKHAHIEEGEELWNYSPKIGVRLQCTSAFVTSFEPHHVEWLWANRQLSRYTLSTHSNCKTL
jgi:hypothetical protein